MARKNHRYQIKAWATFIEKVAIGRAADKAGKSISRHLIDEAIKQVEKVN